MSKKVIFASVIVLILFIFSWSTSNVSTFTASALEPSKIKIYVGPSSVFADNNVYDSIFVQLQDSQGAPARALENTEIRLSSSLTHVGEVDSLITITKGSTFASAKFYSTYTPGTTTITAAASGYPTAQASITTVGPIPSTLVAYAFPPTVPADGNSYEAIIVQLQDSSGSPAKAPRGDLEATLTSSNVTVGTVDASVVIKAGDTYAVARFTANSVGSTAITAIAQGYSSKQTTIATLQPVGEAVSLKVYVGPPKVLADGVIYKQVAVQLQNAAGRIAQNPVDTNVSLSSSDINVGTVESAIMIPQSKVYALASFTSTYRSGTTTITAAATDFKSSEAGLATVGPIPSKLAVYCVPPSLPADNQPFDSIVVQLQDATGKPAKDPEGDITVYLFSSAPNAGNVSSSLIIPFGKTHAVGSFFSTSMGNATTITAQASGYDPGQAKMTTYSIGESPVNPTVRTGTVQFHVVDEDSAPVTDANITSTSQPDGVFPLKGTTNETGYVTFLNVIEGTYVFQIAKLGYDSENQTMSFAGGQLAYRTISLSKTPSSFAVDPVLVAAIVIVVIVVLAIAVALIRRRRNTQIDEEIDSEEFDEPEVKVPKPSLKDSGEPVSKNQEQTTERIEMSNLISPAKDDNDTQNPPS